MLSNQGSGLRMSGKLGILGCSSYSRVVVLGSPGCSSGGRILGVRIWLLVVLAEGFMLCTPVREPQFVNSDSRDLSGEGFRIWQRGRGESHSRVSRRQGLVFRALGGNASQLRLWFRVG